MPGKHLAMDWLVFDAHPAPIAVAALPADEFMTAINASRK
jgi:hypothetical protein